MKNPPRLCKKGKGLYKRAQNPRPSSFLNHAAEGCVGNPPTHCRNWPFRSPLVGSFHPAGIEVSATRWSNHFMVVNQDWLYNKLSCRYKKEALLNCTRESKASQVYRRANLELSPFLNSISER